jgi:aminoglycoside 6'-N-acetyltransferase I
LHVSAYAQVGIQTYADRCHTTPVGFLEGWYVEPALRKSGIGALLINAVKSWAIDYGLRELASDLLLHDATALTAHLSVGFEEVERSVKYRWALV